MRTYINRVIFLHNIGTQTYKKLSLLLYIKLNFNSCYNDYNASNWLENEILHFCVQKYSAGNLRYLQETSFELE